MRLVYPIFIEISKHATIEFWKYIFENMAYNILPRCIYVKSTENNSEISVIFRHKVNGFTYYISDQPAKQLYSELYSLLIKNAKLYGLLDYIEQNQPNLDFTNKKIFIKNRLITNYVLEKFKSSGVNEMQKIIKKINIEIAFKNINLKHIVMNNNKIDHITINV